MPKNLIYVEKDITTVEKGIIAHGCNCQGVMGSGVALFLKQKYPQIFAPYKAMCAEYQMDALLGLVNYVTISCTSPSGVDELGIPTLIVANCFTQHLYGENGRYAIPTAINEALYDVVQKANAMNMPVYIPKIGAGRGGLDWNTDVEPIVNQLANIYPETDIYVCSWKE